MPDHCIPYTRKSENNPSDWLSFGENNKWGLHLATGPGSEQSLLMAKKLSLGHFSWMSFLKMPQDVTHHLQFERGGKLMAHNVKNKNMSMLIVALLTLFVASGLGHWTLHQNTIWTVTCSYTGSSYLQQWSSAWKLGQFDTEVDR